MASTKRKRNLGGGKENLGPSPKSPCLEGRESNRLSEGDQLQKLKKRMAEMEKEMEEKEKEIGELKKKKKKIEKVDRDYLQHAIKTIKHAELSSSHTIAGTSLITSGPGKKYMFMLMHRDLCERLLPLLDRDDLNDKDKEQKEKLNEKVLEQKKKFETLTAKLEWPSEKAPLAHKVFCKQMLRIPAALFYEEFQISSSNFVIEKPKLDSRFVRAFEAIRSRYFDAKENDLTRNVKDLLELGLASEEGLRVEKQHEVSTGYKADVAICLRHHFNYLAAVVETNLFTGAGDARLQGIAYSWYDRCDKGYTLYHCAGVGGENFTLRRSLAKLHPSLILAWRGLEVEIYGAIFLSTKHREEPGFAFSFLAHFSLSNPVEAYAMMEWLKEKLRKLQENPASEFPIEEVYTEKKENGGEEKVKLTYTDHIRDKVFKATIREGTESRIVKFIDDDRYGQEVHEHCVREGFAPALYSNEYLPHLRLWMVVMHCDDEFKTVRDALENKKADIPKPELVRQNLREAVECLHTKGYVHGDLRTPNVLVRKDGKVHIIDFDWAGKDKEMDYPRFLNGGIDWPAGAVFGFPIRKNHDVHFLDKMLQELSDL